MSVLSKQQQVITANFNSLLDQFHSFKDIIKKLTAKDVIQIFGLSLAAFSLLYLGKMCNSYLFFKKRGIRTPGFSFFYGNFSEIQKKTYSQALKEWTQKLGKTYGYYEGHFPILVTSDLEIIQEVFVRQTSSFSARKRNHISVGDNSSMQSLIEASGPNWKRMRAIMNPTFSTAKLKVLRPDMLKCVGRLIESVKQNGENEVDMTSFFKKFTMDTIWNCAFGIDINMQTSSDYITYFNKCEGIINEFQKMSLPIYFGAYFYEFKTPMAYFLISIQSLFTLIYGFENTRPFFWLMKKVIDIVTARNAENEKREKGQESLRKDYLQLLMDAYTTERVEFNLKQHEFTKTGFVKKLTLDEVKMNLIMFMLAGYETTSNTLGLCCYVLAKHPDEQDKLCKEIETVFSLDLSATSSEDFEFKYEKLQKLEYMQLFIHEVLRMYPIGNPAVARRCTKTTTIKDIHMPVGLVVAVDVMSLHYDRTIWGPEDPNEFHPERFAADLKLNQLAYMGFGQGARSCIGMKFALQELKYALVQLLKNFRVVPGPHTPERLEFSEGLVRSPKSSVNVVFKKRA